MKKFIATADWQVWPMLWTKHASMTGDTVYAVDELFASAQEQACPILCAGDILENGSTGGVSTVLSHLRRLGRKYGEPELLLVEGNHDSSGYTAQIKNESWFRLFCEEERHVHFREYTTQNGLTVSGIDYQLGRKPFEEALDEFRVFRRDKPLLDVLLLHQGLGSLLPFEGSWEVREEELCGLARVIVIGHVHTPLHKVLEDGTVLLSPGSLAYEDSAAIPRQTEADGRGWYEVGIPEEGEEGEVEAVRRGLCRSRPFLRLYALTPEDEERVLRQLEDISPFSPTSESRACSPGVFRMRISA